MVSTLADWLQQHSNRVASHHRAMVETTKILVGLTLAVAATLVATALQVGRANGLDVVASILLGVTLLASIGVVIMDRLKEPDRQAAEQRRTAHGWTEARMLEELRDLAIDAEIENETVVRQVRRATEVQVILAMASAGFAAVSLLIHTS